MSTAPVSARQTVTDETEWVTLVGHLPELAISTRRVVVVSPHPDDETLAVGGLLASLAARDVDVEVLAVTDGRASGLATSGGSAERRAEQDQACRALGLAGTIERLSLPDAGVVDHIDHLVEVLGGRCDAETVLVAPWERDGDADHEACGLAAHRVASTLGATLLAYPVRAWQWADVKDLANLPLRKISLDLAVRRTKGLAIDCYRSQISDDLGESTMGFDAPRYFLRPWEVVVHVQ